jgi:hypothetical protein
VEEAAGAVDGCAEPLAWHVGAAELDQGVKVVAADFLGGVVAGDGGVAVEAAIDQRGRNAYGVRRMADGVHFNTALIRDPALRRQFSPKIDYSRYCGVLVNRSRRHWTRSAFPSRTSTRLV